MSDLQFDDVIVGGGSAGCVLANRLSANAARRVLLIEAGRDLLPGAEPAEILDSYPMPLFFGERYIWPGLKAVAAKGRAGSVYEQGRVMGGGSSINVQAANRGLPRDYDEWRELGASGWGWNDVLPYFCRLESDLDYDGPLHGKDGPIAIRRIRRQDWPPFANGVGEKFAAHGFAFREDQNVEFEDGIFPPAFSNRDDRRVSAAAGYLDAGTRRRSNLELWSESTVQGLVMDGPRASGVSVMRKGQQVYVAAGRIIVTAGALQTPGILMRAGVGPGAGLRAVGVTVVADRAGVGANLRDHPALTLCQFLPPHLRLPAERRRASFAALRCSSGIAGCEASDIYITASARAGWHAIGERLGLYFLWCNRPYSTGRVSLVSSDPSVYPAVELNLLSDQRDVERMCWAVKLLTTMILQPTAAGASEPLFPASFSPRIRKLSRFNTRNRVAARAIGAALDLPAVLRHALVKTFLNGGAAFADILSDRQALERFVRDNVFGVWHASGTCRMGDPSDPLAVVDPKGRVIGVENLFVADASIMPRLPTANTNLPTIMIAEKIADSLLSS
jgi:5-(hydroxymethyl)furfural/furfural oxidase